MAVDISHELALWLYAQARKGAERVHVETVLGRHGLDPAQIAHLYDVAFHQTPGFRAALEESERRLVAAQEAFGDPSAPRPAPLIPHAPFQATATIAAGANAWPAAHGQVRVVARCAQPHVVLLDNLLSIAECEALVAGASDRLRRADVVDSERGGSTIDARRTSELTTLARGTTPLVAAIESRIAAITGVPVEHGEGLQVMRYGVGGEYQPHFDYFHPSAPGERALLANGGQRTGSLIMYLSDVERGGATVFPRIGLDVVPRRGSAVYFAYTAADSACDPLSFHGGAPVEAGEKWIATKWLRETRFS